MAYQQTTKSSAGAAVLRVVGLTGIAFAVLLAISQKASAYVPAERPAVAADAVAGNITPANARFHGGHRAGFGKRFIGPKFGLKRFHGGFYHGFFGQGRIFHKGHFGPRFGFRKFRGERFRPRYIGKHHGYHSPGQF